MGRGATVSAIPKVTDLLQSICLLQNQKYERDDQVCY